MPVPALTARALEAISAHPLTGNVRELENLLHRAVALSDGEELQVDWPTGSPEGVALRSAPAPTSVGAAEADVPGSAGSISAVSTSGPAPLLPTTGSAALLPNDLQAWLDQQERDILVRALREANFNRTATAARLGISLRQIRYRIERLNIALPGDPDPNEDIVG